MEREIVVCDLDLCCYWNVWCGNYLFPNYHAKCGFGLDSPRDDHGCLNWLNCSLGYLTDSEGCRPHSEAVLVGVWDLMASAVILCLAMRCREEQRYVLEEKPMVLAAALAAVLAVLAVILAVV